MVQYTSKGNPYFTVAGYRLALTSTDPKEKDKWKWINIVAPEKKIEIAVKKKGKKTMRTISSHDIQRDIVAVDMTGIKTKLMSAGLKNKIAKVMKKYVRDGYIHRENIEAIYKDLQKISESAHIKNDVVERIELVLDEDFDEEEEE